MHGQEINSFRRKTRSKALHEFKLHRQEKFLYVCDTQDWERQPLPDGPITVGIDGGYGS